MSERQRFWARNAASALVAVLVTSVLIAPTSLGARSRDVTTTSAVTTTTLACSPTKVISSWSLTRRANELIIVPVYAVSISAATWVARGGYGGVILLGTSAPPHLAASLSTMRAAVPGHLGLLVMTDDEGGGVWRLSNLITPLPWARTMAATMTTAQITAAARRAGAQMAASGINVDLAPVLDLDGRNVEPGPVDPDGYRSFSASASTTSIDGRAFMKGLGAAHVVAVIKHFPGLGGTSPNTDNAPAATAPWSVLRRSGLIPFRDAIAAGAPAVMLSNASTPGLTNLPASISSSVITGVLRHQLGFRGLILTDSLSTGAISALHLSIPTAATRAVAAGADAVLFGVPHWQSTPSLVAEVSAAIVSAVVHGVISRDTLDAAVVAVLSARGATPCAPAG